MQGQSVLSSSAPLRVVLTEKESNGVTGMAAETRGSWTQLLGSRTFSEAVERQDGESAAGEAQGNAQGHRKGQ